jgi:hypothetical protein
MNRLRNTWQVFATFVVMIAAVIVHDANAQANLPFLSNVFIRATGIRLNLATNEEAGTLRYNPNITGVQFYSQQGWTNVGDGLGFPLKKDVSAAGFSITNVGILIATQGLFNSLSSYLPVPYQFLQTHPTGGHVYTYGTRLVTNYAEWVASVDNTNVIDDLYPGQLMRYNDSVYIVKSPIFETNYYGTSKPFPSTSTNFALFVSKGGDGATGTTGANGLDGLGNAQYGVWSGLRGYVYDTNTPIVVSYAGRWYDLLVSNTNVPPNGAGATNYWAISVDKGANATLIGLTNLVVRGNYDSGQPYVSNDVVYYQGNTFVKITNDASTGQTPLINPTNGVGINGQYWDVLVARGSQGVQGEDGNVLSYTYYITNQFNVQVVSDRVVYVNNPFSNAVPKFHRVVGSTPDATNYFGWESPVWSLIVSNNGTANQVTSNSLGRYNVSLFTNYVRYINVTTTTAPVSASITGSTLYLNAKIDSTQYLAYVNLIESTNTSRATITNDTLYLNIKTNAGGGGSGNVTWTSTWAIASVGATTNDTALLPHGSSGTLLRAQGTAAFPIWETPSADYFDSTVLDLTKITDVFVPSVPLSPAPRDTNAVSYKMLADYVSANAVSSSNATSVFEIDISGRLKPKTELIIADPLFEMDGSFRIKPKAVP